MMFSKQFRPYQIQLVRLEAFTPILLAIHGLVILIALGGKPTTWGLVALTGILGLISFIPWRVRADFTLIRASCLLVFSLFLLFTTRNSNGFFLLWFFVIVSIYPIVLRSPYNLILPLVIAGSYLTMLRFPSAQNPTVIVWARALLLLYIGLLTQKLGSILNGYVLDMDALIQQASDGIFITDLDGNFIEINQRGCQMLGCVKEEILQRNIRDVIVIEPDSPPLRFAEVLAGETIQTERVFRRKDGSQLPVEISAKMIDGQRLQGIARDITERKQTDEKLRAAEASYHALVENTLEGMGRSTLDGKMLAANPALVRLNGYDTEAELIAAVNDIAQEWYVEPNRRAEFVRLLNEHGEVRNFESEIYRHKTRERIWISESSRLVRDANGEPLWLEATIQDITGRKQAEQALRESEERYRHFIQQTTEAIYLYDVHTRQVLDANPAFLNLLGYTSAEAMQLTLYDIVAHSPENIDGYYERLIQHGSIVIGERKWRRKNGTLVDVDVTVSQVSQNGHVQAFALAHDITERKRAEQALSLSKAQLLANLDNTPNVAIQWYDKEGHVLYWNPASESMYGWKSEDVIGKTLDQLIHTPEEQAEFMHVLAEVQETGKPFGPYEARVRRQDGDAGWVMATTFSIPMDDEQIGFVCMDVDITERKQAEVALRESEQKFSTLFEKAPFSITLSKLPEGIIVDANATFEQHFGFTRQETLGKTSLELGINPDPETRARVLAMLNKNHSVRDMEMALQAKSGTTRIFSVNLDWVDIGGQKYIINAAQDITERKQSEEKLRESEEKFHALAEYSIEGIILVDETRVVYVNPAYCEITGLSVEECLALSMTQQFEIIHPEDRARTIERQTRLRRGEAVKELDELRIVRKDGSQRTALLSTKSFSVEEKPYRLGVIVDITERKQAEAALRESESKYRLLFENMKEGFSLHELILDEKGKAIDFRFLDANEAYEQHTGFKRQNVIGRTMREILPQADPRQIENYGKVALTGEPQIIEYYSTAFSRYLRVRAFSTEYGRFATIFEDITERKQAEEKVQIQNQRLKALREIDTAILAADSVERIAHVALEHVRELIHCQRSGLALIDWGKNEAVNFEVRTDQETSLPKGASVSLTLIQGTIQILAENQPILVNDLTTLKDPPVQIQDIIKEGLRSVCILPLFSQSQLIGSFSMSSETPDFFDEEKISLGREVANQIAIAITQSRLVEALQRINTDLEILVQERTAALAQANTLLQTLLDYTPDHIFFKDLQSRFIRNSKSQAAMLGLSDPAEVVGKTDFDFFSHAQRAYDDEQSIIKSGEPMVDFEEHVTWPDKHETWVATTKVPLRDPEGRIIGTFGIARDITDRKRAEEALRKAKDELEIRVAERTAEVKHTNEQLRIELAERKQIERERETLIAELTAKNAELERFTYTVSHDLKSPLVTMKGFLGYLEQDLLTGNEERLRGDMRRIANAVDRMQELLNDLLELSRIGRFVNEPEFIPLEDLATAAIELVDGRLKEHGVKVHLQPNLPIVHGDRQRLTEVLQNLLDNAAKYMGEQVEPQIEIGQRGMEAGLPVIYVKDNGIGIPAEYHERIFGLFNKLDSQSEGTGIGLALVKRIIEYHGGRIWVESKIGHGSMFFFTLPSQPKTDSVI